jgi:hypothetical protein
MRTLRKIFILALFSIIYLNGFGQNENKQTAESIIEIADEAYFNLRIILVANEQYKMAAEIAPENIEANYMAGRTSLQTYKKADAIKYLLKVYEIDSTYKRDVLYMIGQGYQYGFEFENAITYYQKYLNSINQSDAMAYGENAQRRIKECRIALEYVKSPRDYIIENAGPEINSEWDDFAPVVTRDNSYMAFTTRRQLGNSNEDVFDDMLYYEDVFYTRKLNNKWISARNIGMPINTKLHSSNLAISLDGKQLYLFRDQNGGDIFLSNLLADGTWSNPEPLNDNINSPYFENSVSISPDGNTLYFSSDRPKSNNSTDLDIYYSNKNEDGQWGPAVNIGPTINTSYDEDSPFIDYNNKTLYFSSEGHLGMGGYDIYMSNYDEKSKTWSLPENMGYPLNSPDNDVHFVTTNNGKSGYYASAKQEGMGFTDIYHIQFVGRKPIEEPVLASSETELSAENLAADLSDPKENFIDGLYQNPQLEKSIDAFKRCMQNPDNQTYTCNQFIGESIQTVYKIDDFYAHELGRYLNGTEIYSFVESSDQWEMLGYAHDQKALDIAQDNANKNKAVIAVYLDKEVMKGHSALILPGKKFGSENWEMDVPNTLSYFMNDPQSSYFNKGLSFAFKNAVKDSVLIYTRK